MTGDSETVVAAVVAFVYAVVADFAALELEAFEFGCFGWAIANTYVVQIVRDDEAKLGCRAARRRLGLWACGASKRCWKNGWKVHSKATTNALRSCDCDCYWRNSLCVQ